MKGIFDVLPADIKVREQLQYRLREEGREALHQQLSAVDPESGQRVHLQDTQRLIRGLEIYLLTGIPWSVHLRRPQETTPPVQFENIVQFVLQRDREQLYQRIEKRSGLMMEMGLVEEVEGLRNMGYSSDLPSMGAIGYRHVNTYLDGLWDRPTMMTNLVRDTRRYAKRQLTWFRRDVDLHIYDPQNRNGVISHIDRWLKERKK